MNKDLLKRSLFLLLVGIASSFVSYQTVLPKKDPEAAQPQAGPITVEKTEKKEEPEKKPEEKKAPSGPIGALKEKLLGMIKNEVKKVTVFTVAGVLKDVYIPAQVHDFLKEAYIENFEITGGIKDIDESFGVKGDVNFQGHVTKAKVFVAKTGIQDAPYGASLTIEVPEKWKLSDLFSQLGGLDKFSFPSGRLIVSNFDYKDPDTDVEVKRGLNFLADVDLTGPLAPVATFAQKAGVSITDLGKITLRGVIKPEIKGSSFAAVIPVRISVNFADLYAKKKIPARVPLIKSLTTGNLEMGIDADGKISFGTGVIIGLTTQATPIELRSKVGVGPTESDLGVKLEEPIFITLWGKGLAELSKIGLQGNFNYAVLSATGLPSGLGFRGSVGLGQKPDRVNMNAAAHIKFSAEEVPKLAIIGNIEEPVTITWIVKFLNDLLKVSIPTKGIPDISLSELDIYVVPTAVNIADKQYAPAIRAQGGMSILGASGGLKMELNEQERRVTGSGWVSNIKNDIFRLTGPGRDGKVGTADDGPIVSLLIGLPGGQAKQTVDVVRFILNGEFEIPKLEFRQKVEVDVQPTGGTAKVEGKIFKFWELAGDATFDLKDPEKFGFGFTFSSSAIDWLEENLPDQFRKLQKELSKTDLPGPLKEVGDKALGTLNTITSFALKNRPVSIKKIGGRFSAKDIKQGKLPGLTLDMTFKWINKDVTLDNVTLDLKNPAKTALELAKVVMKNVLGDDPFDKLKEFFEKAGKEILELAEKGAKEVEKAAVAAAKGVEKVAEVGVKEVKKGTKEVEKAFVDLFGKKGERKIRYLSEAEIQSLFQSIFKDIGSAQDLSTGLGNIQAEVKKSSDIATKVVPAFEGYAKDLQGALTFTNNVLTNVDAQNSLTKLQALLKAFDWTTAQKNLLQFGQLAQSLAESIQKVTTEFNTIFGKLLTDAQLSAIKTKYVGFEPSLDQINTVYFQKQSLIKLLGTIAQQVKDLQAIYTQLVAISKLTGINAAQTAQDVSSIISISPQQAKNYLTALGQAPAKISQLSSLTKNLSTVSKSLAQLSDNIKTSYDDATKKVLELSKAGSDGLEPFLVKEPLKTQFLKEYMPQLIKPEGGTKVLKDYMQRYYTAVVFKLIVLDLGKLLVDNSVAVVQNLSEGANSVKGAKAGLDAVGSVYQQLGPKAKELEKTKALEKLTGAEREPEKASSPEAISLAQTLQKQLEANPVIKKDIASVLQAELATLRIDFDKAFDNAQNNLFGNARNAALSPLNQLWRSPAVQERLKKISPEVQALVKEKKYAQALDTSKTIDDKYWKEKEIAQKAMEEKAKQLKAPKFSF